MRKISIILLLFFVSCQSNISQFNLENYLNKKKVIYSKTNDKYFYPTLKACNLFNYLQKSDIVSNKTYYLYNEDNLESVIHEITFINDSKLIDKAYEEIEKYTNYRRNLKRKNFGNLCFEPFNMQFYFIIRKNNCLYLIGSGNQNFIFESGDISVNDILNKNNLFFYKVYNEINN